MSLGAAQPPPDTELGLRAGRPSESEQLPTPPSAHKSNRTENDVRLCLQQSFSAALFSECLVPAWSSHPPSLGES